MPAPQRFDAVEAHVRDLVATGALPHAQFLALRGEEVLHAFHLGKAREDGRALQPDALYRIASMTKPVTAALFLMLVEEGRVALDDPVASVLPELADLPVYVGGLQPPFATRAAVRQPRMIDLLMHTSGFAYGIRAATPLDQAYWKGGVYNFKATLTREGVLAHLVSLPLEHDPGAAFTYSFGLDLIGLIAERLTDRPLDELFATRIFDPLGMVDTGMTLRGDQMERFTDAWAIHPRRGLMVYDRAEDSLWSRPLTFPSGGGGLLSTVADYRRFCAMLLGEGERLLKPETLALMMRNHLPGGADMRALLHFHVEGIAHDGSGQGLGIAVALPGGNAMPAGTAYWPGMFQSWFSVIPSERISLIFMTQQVPLAETGLVQAVHGMLFG